MNYEVSIIPKHIPVIAVKTGDGYEMPGHLILSVVTCIVICKLRKELKKSLLT